MKETEVQKKILKKLREKGVFCWRVNNTGIPDPTCRGGWRKQTGYNMPGMSDIIGIYNGKFLAIEVKCPTRIHNVSDDQDSFLQKVEDERGISMVAGSWEDVKITLDKMRKIPYQLRRELRRDPFYRRCSKAYIGFDSNCDGRITWEHAITYAGKQVNEWWAIIPLCEYHHSVGQKWQARGDLDKRFNEWVALSRLFNSSDEYIEEMKKKYPKAFNLWVIQCSNLIEKYGEFKHGQRYQKRS